MKKTAVYVLIIIVLTACCAFLLVACNKTDDGKLSVVCTIFPEYDWTKNVVGDNDVNLTLLIKNGSDMHSFQPSVADIAAVSRCDVFIYVGGVSNTWAEEVIAQAENKSMKVVRLSSAVNLKDEEQTEGMQGDGDDDEKDEHIWLSPKNAVKAVGAIASALAEADPNCAESYSQNAENYVQSLNALDAEYTSAVDAAAVKTVVFADRFPFRYLADDYGISYYAAFPGCSAETEASFATVTFLAGKIDDLGLKYVFTVDGSDGRIAQTVIGCTATKNQTVLRLDSMQSVSKDYVENKTYLGVMESNLTVLKTALSNIGE